MAMNANDMGDEILAAIKVASDADPGDRQKLFRAFAAAMISHIQNNSQITFRVTDAGIQTSTTAGTPTASPAAPVQLAAGQIA